jgi:Zn finger protein HypA/HybF involved in hydrogenase expression
MHPEPRKANESEYECPRCGHRSEEELTACPECDEAMQDISATRE